MKTIEEIRKGNPERVQHLNSFARHFINREIDLNVWLPTLRINLQRGDVWSTEQKRELIWSIIYERKIPTISIVITKDDVHQVIDGKQRLSAILGFWKEQFSLLIDGKTYKKSELPEDYQMVLDGYMLDLNVIYENKDRIISDETKINWFKFVNFAGTPMDVEHLNKLDKLPIDALFTTKKEYKSTIIFEDGKEK